MIPYQPTLVFWLLFLMIPPRRGSSSVPSTEDAVDGTRKFYCNETEKWAAEVKNLHCRILLAGTYIRQ
jgi:hypothetical protein